MLVGGSSHSVTSRGVIEGGPGVVRGPDFGSVFQIMAMLSGGSGVGCGRAGSRH